MSTLSRNPVAVGSRSERAAGGLVGVRSGPARALRRVRWIARRAAWGAGLLVSAVVLVGVLAILAAIPVVNIYVLGYMLEAEGRMGRGRRMRAVLPWVRYAPRIAVIVCGTAICLVPNLVLSDFARAAVLIDPNSQSARVLWWTSLLFGFATAGYLFFVYARGGSLFAFLRPIKTLRIGWRRLRSGTFGDSIAEKWVRAGRELRVAAYFWLGLRGLAVAFLWLVLPCVMIAAVGPSGGGSVLLKLGGMMLLAVVFTVLLVLQANMAAWNRFSSGFAIREGWRTWSAAPLAWVIAGLVTAVLSLPLFLFKIVLPPADAMWLLTPMFIAAMLPARLTAGWAYRRARRRGRRCHWLLLLLTILVSITVGGIYAGGVTASQYINEHGRRAVLEQHAFSLPVPF